MNIYKLKYIAKKQQFKLSTSQVAAPSMKQTNEKAKKVNKFTSALAGMCLVL